MELALEVARVGAAIALALLVILAVWLLASPIGFAARRVLENIGFFLFADWIRAQLSQLRPDRVLVGSFRPLFVGLGGTSEGRVVRVVVDERLRKLQKAMRNMVASMRKATQNLEGLGRGKGPASLVSQVRAIDRESAKVAALGGEIPEDLLKDYQAHAHSAGSVIVLVVLAALFATVNGTLLNLFFRDVFTSRVLGVPASALLSVGFVAAEIALGFGIAFFTGPGSRAIRFGLILAIATAMLFESVIFGIVSYGFQLDIVIFDQQPWMKAWMAPLGLMFVMATSVTGYLLHRTFKELAEHRGALRLRREMNAANAFVRGLPTRWERISRSAREAENAISAYLDALGGKASTLTGAVEQIRQDREGVTLALVEAKVDEWRQWLDGEAGDQHRHDMANAAIAIATVVVAAGFLWAFASVGLRAVGTRLPELAVWAGAAILTVGFYTLGLFPFDRLHYIKPDSVRVFPNRTAAGEVAAVGLIALAGAAAIIWTSVTALGSRGMPVALTLLGGAVALACLGYHLERLSRGLVLVGVTLVSSTVAVVAGVGAALLHVGWLVWVLIHLTRFLVLLVSYPWEHWIKPLFERRAPGGPGNGVSDQAAAPAS